MKSYVLGFVFSQGFYKVVLIRKNHPKWQKGKLNGVGGKIEPGETALTAMVREFKEETGVKTAGKDWVEVSSIRFSRAEVYIFALESERVFAKAETVTPEDIVKHDISDILRLPVINNLPFLIPLAIQRLQNRNGQAPSSFSFIQTAAPDLHINRVYCGPGR